MQTFLPYSDFSQSAKVLDYKRLGKQRVEVLQLLNKRWGITKGKGWTNHPCFNMWKDNPNMLVEYGLVICKEWISRGYKDTCYEKIKKHYKSTENNDKPSWLGREDIHLSHKSKLIQKDRAFYSPLFPGVKDDLEYVWPVL